MYLSCAGLLVVRWVSDSYLVRNIAPRLGLHQTGLYKQVITGIEVITGYELNPSEVICVGL